MHLIPMVQTVLLWLVLLMPVDGQENWPEFRGPSGDGHAVGAGIPVEINEAKNVKWKTPIHGRGWSSPVVWDEQIWLTTATEDGNKMFGDMGRFPGLI